MAEPAESPVPEPAPVEPDDEQTPAPDEPEELDETSGEVPV